MVSAKTFPDDEVGVKRFLGDCPKCYRVLLIDSPDIEDTRYCICPSCQQCLCYGNDFIYFLFFFSPLLFSLIIFGCVFSFFSFFSEISKNCCGGWWPLFISCRECQKSISLPQRENDSSSHSFVFAIVSFLFSCSIFCLIIAFVIGHTFMFIIAVTFFFFHLFSLISSDITLLQGEFFLMGFSILLILYLQFFYHKWRWGTAQEIRFESEHLPETLDILTDLSRIGKDLTLNIKRSHQYDSFADRR